MRPTDALWIIVQRDSQLKDAEMYGQTFLRGGVWVDVMTIIIAYISCGMAVVSTAR